MSLTSMDRAVLDFEASWWTRHGAKSTGMRNELRMSSSAYYRRLAALVDDLEALGYDPLVVRRLRRRRSERLRGRFEGALQGHSRRR